MRQRGEAGFGGGGDGRAAFMADSAVLETRLQQRRAFALGIEQRRAQAALCGQPARAGPPRGLAPTAPRGTARSRSARRRVAVREVAGVVGAQHARRCRHARGQHRRAAAHRFQDHVGAAFQRAGVHQHVGALDPRPGPRSCGSRRPSGRTGRAASAARACASPVASALPMCVMRMSFAFAQQARRRRTRSAGSSPRAGGRPRPPHRCRLGLSTAGAQASIGRSRRPWRDARRAGRLAPGPAARRAAPRAPASAAASVSWARSWYRSVPVNTTARPRLGPGVPWPRPAIEAAERRACSASITSSSFAAASGHSCRMRTVKSSARCCCPPACGRQLPLLAAASAGLTITTDGATSAL
jgi:hypothetical protein